MLKRNLPSLTIKGMKAYRVFFKKNGINLTKLVYAESLLEVISQFNGIEVMMIKEVDMSPDSDI